MDIGTVFLYLPATEVFCGATAGIAYLLQPWHHRNVRAFSLLGYALLFTLLFAQPPSFFFATSLYAFLITTFLDS